MRVTYSLLFILSAGLALPLQAQTSDEEWLSDCRSNNWRSSRSQVCEVRTFNLPAGPINADGGHNGGVLVRGVTGANGILLHARIQAQGESRQEAAEIARAIRITTSGTIEATGPDRNSWSVVFVFDAPTRTDVTANAYNGPVGARELTGSISLTTRNGPVDLSGVGGDVHARSENGPINLRLSGSGWSGAGLDAVTTNGPIRLRIPDGYSARLETGTRNGPFRTDFPLNVTLIGDIHRRVNATLGSGGALIRVVTTNGPVTITRVNNILTQRR